MRNIWHLLTVCVVAGLVGLGAAAPASATDDEPHYPAAGWALHDTDITDEVDWSDCDPAPTRSEALNSEIVGPYAVNLQPWTADAAPPHYGTSIETTDLGLAGDTVTVDYELWDANPQSGAIRLFIYESTEANTDCDGPTELTAVPDEGGSGTLTIEVPFDGEIGTLGLVYDSSNGGENEGIVHFSNLTVDERLVRFVPPPEKVTPPEPTHTNKTCDAPATITLPEAEGVEWSLGGAGAEMQAVDPGTSQTAPGTHHAIASPAEGYTFGKDDDGEVIETEKFTVAVLGPEQPCPGETGPPGPQGPAGEDGDDGEDGESVIMEDDTETTSSETLPKTGAPGTALLAALGGGLLLSGAGLVGANRLRTRRR